MSEAEDEFNKLITKHETELDKAQKQKQNAIEIIEREDKILEDLAIMAKNAREIAAQKGANTRKSNEFDKQVTAKNKEIDSLNERIKSVIQERDDTIAKSKVDVKAVQVTLAEKVKEIGTLGGQIRELKTIDNTALVESLNSDVTNLNEKIKKLERLKKEEESRANAMEGEKIKLAGELEVALKKENPEVIAGLRKEITELKELLNTKTTNSTKEINKVKSELGEALAKKDAELKESVKANEELQTQLGKFQVEQEVKEVLEPHTAET